MQLHFFLPATKFWSTFIGKSVAELQVLNSFFFSNEVDMVAKDSLFSILGFDLSLLVPGLGTE